MLDNHVLWPVTALAPIVENQPGVAPLEVGHPSVTIVEWVAVQAVDIQAVRFAGTETTAATGGGGGGGGFGCRGLAGRGVSRGGQGGYF